MIPKREILAAASATGLLHGVVEKDYVLGWLLAGIHAHPDLRGGWVFKGGTCLKKCYFDNYRFSEDLDFTLRDQTPDRPAVPRSSLPGGPRMGRGRIGPALRTGSNEL